jgi:hypothetical protein
MFLPNPMFHAFVLALLPLSVASRGGSNTPEVRTYGGLTRVRMLELDADEEAVLQKCDEATASFLSANPTLQAALNSLNDVGSTELSRCMEQFGFSNNISCNIDYETLQGGTTYNSFVAACAKAGGILLPFDASGSCADESYSMTLSVKGAVCVPADDACDSEEMTSLLEKSFVCTPNFSTSGGWAAYHRGLMTISGIISFLTISGIISFLAVCL